jgi:hypothetical protein
MAPLTLKPSLSSGQVPEAPCEHTLHISFPPNRQCARCEKPQQRRRGGTRTNDKGTASYSYAALPGEPWSPRVHERRVKI